LTFTFSIHLAALLDQWSLARVYSHPEYIML
jgi:hypothetical protein